MYLKQVIKMIDNKRWPKTTMRFNYG